MVGYLDSSLVLRAIFAGDNGIDQAWSLEEIYSSELLEIECRRAILRDRSNQLLTDEQTLDQYDRLRELLTRVQLLELDAPIKRRAMEAFPLRVKTLDALHLATALAIAQAYPDELVTVFSYDQGMNRAAKLLGFVAPFYSTAGRA